MLPTIFYHNQRPILNPTENPEPYKPSARIPFPVASPARSKVSWLLSHLGTGDVCGSSGVMSPRMYKTL